MTNISNKFNKNLHKLGNKKLNEGMYFKKSLFRIKDLNSSFFNNSILIDFEDMLKKPLNLGIVVK